MEMVKEPTTTTNCAKLNIDINFIIMLQLLHKTNHYQSQIV